MRVVATAGHVDHGKSTLVQALTGTDPDRFPEEKRRGLTIDLGFAFTTLDSGETVGFVDVPGHVKFVKNMLAGVGAVEVAMLVVAANEGWMPQSEEHLRILELLDVRHGLVALTKVDLVDDETVELARLELIDHLDGTALAGWPVVAIDGRSGAGVSELRATLDRVLVSAPAARDVGRPRLWIDRVFSSKGAGTVVTGTLVGGSLAVDDDIVVEPGQRTGRVRGIESAHQPLQRVGAGSRVALNVAGVSHDEITRGHAVVRPGQWRAVSVADVALTPLPGVAVPRRTTVQTYVGSGEHAGRFRLLDDGLARLRFDVPLPLAPGDRVVLRSSARRATLGGAEVLDVNPPRRAADAIERAGLPLGERVLAARPWCTDLEMVPLAGVDAAGARELAGALVATGAAVQLDRWLVAEPERERLRAKARAEVALHHADHPTSPGLELAALASAAGVESAMLRAALADDATLVVDRDIVHGRDHATDPTDDPRAALWLEALADTPYAPPAPEEYEVPPDLVRALARAERVENVDGVWFGSAELARARTTVGAAVQARGSLTIADIRDLLGSTRKFVVPLAGYLDARGVTRRRGDDRIPGPKAGG